MYALNGRRKLSLLILFFLVLFSFAAYSSNLWLQWTVVTSLWFFLVLTDFVFLGENVFVFDPNLESWQAATGDSAHYD